MLWFYFFFECYADHRDLHCLTHSFPTRRSADLRYILQREVRVALLDTGQGEGERHGVDPFRFVGLAALPASGSAAWSMRRCSSGSGRPSRAAQASTPSSWRCRSSCISAVGRSLRSATTEPLPWRVAITPARSSRSEEHTSELQSLMRISYSVFCL